MQEVQLAKGKQKQRGRVHEADLKDVGGLKHKEGVKGTTLAAMGGTRSKKKKEKKKKRKKKKEKKRKFSKNVQKNKGGGVKNVRETKQLYWGSNKKQRSGKAGGGERAFTGGLTKKEKKNRKRNRTTQPYNGEVNDLRDKRRRNIGHAENPKILLTCLKTAQRGSGGTGHAQSPGGAGRLGDGHIHLA